MSADPKLTVVLCWHMHQPQYQDLISGQYQLPWTYLHGIKDYVDMAAHLESAPEARAVVNFAPILLEQIEDYAAQVRGFLQDSKPIRDPMLAALDMAALPSDQDRRLSLVRGCLRASEDRMIKRFARYAELAELARWHLEHPGSDLYLSDQFLVDLVMWYHLAWLGETVRRRDRRVKDLVDRGRGFGLGDRRQLLAIIGELLGSLPGRYRALAEEQRIELAMSPYAHPIVPLLLDLRSAREAMPDAPLPDVDGYPGGRARAVRHLRRGREVFERFFGRQPEGCWASEGSLSDATLELIEEEGFSWVASGESVLRNSLAQAGGAAADAAGGQPLVRPYQVADGSLACFFRDDGLSDLIGFTYADWHADDAVANLVHHLEHIEAAGREQGPRVVSVILDGENAWEYYPENGYYFLNALYASLGDHERLRLGTFSEVLADAEVRPGRLPGLVAGSWVYGTFSTWVGDRAKNRGWEMLVDAKRAFDAALASGRLDSRQQELAERQLCMCEGSDWFWWFGDYNPADTVSDFEHLFRLHLANLYQILGAKPPEYLSRSFTKGQGAPSRGGVMRKGSHQS